MAGDAGRLGRFVGEARPRLRQRQGIELDAERADWRHSGADNFASASNVKLIVIDASWKYDASGTDLGTAWRGLAYNDSAWASRVGFTNRAITTLFNTGVAMIAS
jgi:hypothetical protein